MGGDVPVHQAQRAAAVAHAVDVRQGFRRLGHQVQGAREAEAQPRLPGALHHQPEVAPAHQLHRQVVLPVDLVELEHLHHVGVAETAGQPRLLHEHPDEVAARLVLARGPA